MSYKILTRICLMSLITLLAIGISAPAFALDNVGQYYIQLTSCTTMQDAQVTQQTISSSRCLATIASEGYSTTLSISTIQKSYVVEIGNYPTFGEAHYIFRELSRAGYTGVIHKYDPPTPSLSSLKGTADDIYSQATMYDNIGAYSGATVCYTAFVNLYANDTRAYQAFLRMGYIKTLLHDTTGAIAAFQAVGNSNTNLAPEALLRAAYLYLSTGDLINAQSLFQSIVTQFPTSSFDSEAQTELGYFSNTGPESALFNSGILKMSTLNYSQATILFNQYITAYPTGSYIDQAWLQFGKSCLHAGDRTNALLGYQHLIQYKNSSYAQEGCVRLSNLVLSMGGKGNSYIDQAINALRQSPCLDTTNQQLGGLFQTYIGYLYLNGKVPLLNNGKWDSTDSTLSAASICRIAINECHKVRELYPNASRMDLARSNLMEIEGYYRFNDETTFRNLARQMITDYSDQSGYCCYAQFLIGVSYDLQTDTQDALHAFQLVLDNYTDAPNITNLDDIIAMDLLRKAYCLEKLGQNYDAITTLQQIIQYHSQSGFIVRAKQELATLSQGVMVSGHSALSQMNAQQLKDLGKQKLAQNQYSKVINIYNELKKRYPTDIIFQDQNELLISIADTTIAATLAKLTTHEFQMTFAYQTIHSSLTTLPYIKIRRDSIIITNCDVPDEVIEQLINLSSMYKDLGDYEKALNIIKNLREIYVDKPWNEDMLKKVKRERWVNKSSTYLDFASRFQMAEILEKQGKKQEAISQLKTILSMKNNNSIMNKIPSEDRQRISDDIEKNVNDKLKKLE